MNRTFALCALVLTVLAPTVGAQTRTSAAYTGTDDLTDVRPFQAWVTDAVFTRGVDIEPELRYQDYDFGKLLIAGARTAVWVTNDIEAGGRWGFASVDPDVGDGNTGLRDLDAYLRYRLPIDEDFVASVGGEFSLPIGDAESGGDSFDFRGFGAMRYDVDGNLTLLASAGLESIEIGNDRELGLLLGGGTIIPMTEEVALIAELNFSTASDVAQVTGGVDVELPPGGHLRAALALGLDNDAPNYELILGFAIPVY